MTSERGERGPKKVLLLAGAACWCCVLEASLFGKVHRNCSNCVLAQEMWGRGVWEYWM
jgi:hypothetical protein